MRKAPTGREGVGGFNYNTQNNDCLLSDPSNNLSPAVGPCFVLVDTWIVVACMVAALSRTTAVVGNKPHPHPLFVCTRSPITPCKKEPMTYISAS